MTRIAIGVTYDGGSFHGWQRQPGLATVQGTLETAASRVADHPLRLSVAGRTDTGVHATGQVATFDSDAKRTVEDWLRGLNALTPHSLRVDWAVVVPDEFHPRYHAVARRYVYVFHDASRPDPLLWGRVAPSTGLDADAMHRAAQQLIGEHDFSAFRGAGCQSLTPMRRVNHCLVVREGEFVAIDIEANAFLLHMVRNIAAALGDVGLTGRPERLLGHLSSGDRTRLGPTGAPQGLYLTHVSYPGQKFPPGRFPPFLHLG